MSPNAAKMKPSDEELLKSTAYQGEWIGIKNFMDPQIERHCPLDNGRHVNESLPFRHSIGRLDKLPNELFTETMLYLDVMSLTDFRRVNRCAMQLVDGIRQYATIFKHCPDVIRTIVSIQARAFNLDTLYKTLSTSRCSTCKYPGDHLYLLDCRRVCGHCLTRRVEYFPITLRAASKALNSGSTPKRQYLRTATLFSSVLSLPGRCCAYWPADLRTEGEHRRLRLLDRQAVVKRVGHPLPERWDRGLTSLAVSWPL